MKAEITTRIAILEPSSIIAEGLTNILFKTGKFGIYCIDDHRELSQVIRNQALDVIIINPVFVQINHKEFQTIKKNNSGLSWVGLQYTYFDPYILNYFDHIIQINDQPETIVSIINNIRNPESGINETEVSEQLSERETDVLKLLTKGLSSKEIADRLNISIHTVISHRKNITLKTGIKSQSGLTIYAISNRLISL
jgi:DNA-binding CsgD family transcriptional regulator